MSGSLNMRWLEEEYNGDMGRSGSSFNAYSEGEQ